MRQELNELVAENYPRIATDLLEPILQLLRMSRDHCGGDLDKFLVMTVVALRTTRHPDFAKQSPAELISGEALVLPGLGTNARSIAASLGMPNETVRRKVCELIDLGWLVRKGARLYLTGRAYRQLAPLREEIERLAVSHYMIVAALRAAAAPDARRA